jgi:hypothetical protein
LSGLPTMPSPYSTMTGQYTRGTSPGVLMMIPPSAPRQSTQQKKGLFSFFK